MPDAASAVSSGAVSSGALVIVPTHDHASTLGIVLAHLRRQSVDDLEIAVIGDGVGDDTRDVVADARTHDPRITFHDLPKAGRTGEPHRHRILGATARPVVTYVCDDDLLLDDHVASVTEALADADLVVPRPVLIDGDGSLVVEAVELADPAWRDLIAGPRSFVSLSGMSHTLAAYRRLPDGWQVTPAGFYTDQWMYRQFLAQAWCRATTSPRATALRFPSVLRNDADTDERRRELASWAERLSTMTGRTEFDRAVDEATWAEASRWRAWSFAHNVELDAVRANAEATHRDLVESRANAEVAWAETEAARAEADALRADRDAVAAERDALMANRTSQSRRRFGRT